MARRRSLGSPLDFEYLGDYARASLWGAQDVVARLINFLSLLGIALIAAIAYFAKLDFASVAVSFIALTIITIATHYGSFVAYQAERRARAGLQDKLATQDVDLTPLVGHKDRHQDGDHLMWADLAVRNDNPVTLQDVQVRLVQVRNVMDVQRGELYWSKPNQWVAVNVVWSPRNAPPNTLFSTIPAFEERTVSICWCDDSNGNVGVFCLPNNRSAILHSGINKVDLSVSSPDGVSHQESFYLQCHPHYLGGERAHFQFEPWADFIARSGMDENLIKEIPSIAGL